MCAFFDQSVTALATVHVMEYNKLENFYVASNSVSCKAVFGSEIVGGIQVAYPESSAQKPPKSPHPKIWKVATPNLPGLTPLVLMNYE